MTRACLIILACSFGGPAWAQSGTVEDNIKTMPCEDLAVLLTETLSGATGALTESQRLALKNQPPGMVEQMIKNQAMGMALGALPGNAGGIAAQVLGTIEQTAEREKDAKRQRDAAKSQALQAGAVLDLETVAVMSEEHARRCES